MGEFIMPAVFGLSGQQLSVPQDALCADAPSASFGEFMSMVMGSTEISAAPQQVQEPSEDIPQADFTAVLAEAFEAVKEMAADGGQQTEISLPEEFSPKGKEAFVTSLCRFLGNGKGDGAKAEKNEAVTADGEDMQEADIFPEDIRKIWQDVPESEKSLWAELFERIADIAEESGEEGTVFTAALVKLCGVKSAKKSKDAAPDENTAVSAAAMAMFIPAVSVVSVENAASENIVDGDIAVTAVSEAVGNTEDIQNVEIQEIIQIVSDSDISSEELADFFKQAAAALSAQSEAADIKVTDGLKSTETVTDSGIRPEMFAVGRQSVMSRASKPFEPIESESKTYAADNISDENIGAAAVNVPEATAAAKETAVVPQSEEIIPEYDIAEQIVNKIELYKELEGLTAGSQKELTIKLAPEELGELEVKIRSTKDGLEIAFAAERSEAVRLIGDKASALAEAVAAGGSRLREMTVTQQIVTHETGDTLSYGQYGGEANASGGRDFGEGGRRFVFSGSDTDSAETDGGQDPQIFYNKEAKLWVSA